MTLLTCFTPSFRSSPDYIDESSRIVYNLTSSSHYTSVESEEANKKKNRVIDNVIGTFSDDQSDLDAEKTLSVISRICSTIYKKIKIRKKSIISFKNPLKERWDLFVLILAFQNSFIIPLDISFQMAWTENIVY